MTKLKQLKCVTLGAITGLVTLTGGTSNADSNWQHIAAKPGTTVVNGEARDYFPGCALPNMTAYSANEYGFYFKQGKSDKLVVYFNG